MMNYRTQKEDTAGPLFDYYYEVRIPYMSTVSVGYARAVGTYSTTNKDVDRMMNAQWIQTMMPISGMIDKYKEGAQIRVVHEKDIVPIYTAITNHLNAWKDMLERGINIGGAPVDDLLHLDRFAQELYEYAKHHAQPSTMESLAAQVLHNFMPFNASNFFKNVDLSSNARDENGIIRINADKEEPPARQNLETFLKEQMILLRR
jgi:hypothetical protein